MSREPDFSTRAEPRHALSRAEPLLLAIAALLFLGSAASASRSWSEAGASQTYLDGLRSEVDRERARLRALEAQRAGSGSVSLMTSKLVLTAEAPPARVLAQLSELLPPDVRLESVVFSYGARLELEAVVVARRPPSYDLFLERLSASPLFGEIQPGPEAREGEMRGTLRFTYKRLP